MQWATKNKEKIKATPKQKAKCPICESVVIAKCGSIKIWHWSHKSNKDCDDWYEPESEWHKKWKDEFPKECQEFTIGKHRADIRTNKKGILGNFKYQNPIVIELQNSSLSEEKILEREEYYKNMIWVLNGKTIAKNLDLRGTGFKYRTFRWKHPPKSWWYANKDIYIDLGNHYKEILDNLLKRINERKIYLSQFCHKKYGDDNYLGMILYNDDVLHDLKNIEERTRKRMYEFDSMIFQIKKIYKNIPCGGFGYLIKREDFLSKFI